MCSRRYKGNMMVLLLLTYAVLTVSITGGHGMPDECKPENYKELSDQFRVINYHSDVRVTNNDGQKSFVPGWYRFSVVAQRMLQRNELEDNYGFFSPTTFQPCGAKLEDIAFHFGIQIGKLSSPFYVLDSDHPTEEYGLKLANSIGCKYQTVISSTQFPITCESQTAENCTWKLLCDDPNDRTEIAIRKCSGFYVYYLQPTAPQPRRRFTSFPVPGVPDRLKDGIFCGTKELEPPTPTMSQCQQYRSYYDPTRQWDHLQQIKPSQLCKDDLESTAQLGFVHERWTRFYNSTSDNTTMRLPENCPSFTTDYSPLNDGKFFCTAQYRGWLLGNHPTVKEGMVDRKLCFSEANTCKCQMSTVISIMNCGDFYIYKRTREGFPHCFARACTVPDERTKGSTHLSKPSMMMSSSVKSVDMKSSANTKEMIISQSISMEISLTKTKTTIMKNSPMKTIEIIASKSHDTNMVASPRIMSTKSRRITNSPMPTMGIMENKTEMLYSSTKSMGIMSSKSYMKMMSSQMPVVNSTMGIPMATKSLSTTQSITMATAPMSEKGESTSMSVTPTESILMSEETIETMEPATTAEATTSPTTASTTTHLVVKETDTLDLCKNSYRTIIDDTRLGGFSKLLQTGCDKQYYPSVRFMNSKGEDLQLIEGCNTRDQFTKACSPSSNVWLQGNHPNSSFPEVKVLCMRTKPTGFPIDSQFCNCDNKKLIVVQKCSNFFVYRLYPLFLSNRDCIFKYCAEIIPGTKPTTTTKTTIATMKPIQGKKDIFSLDGSIQILNPFVNDAPLRQEDIADKSSATYTFLEKMMMDKLKEAMTDLKGISSVEILGFRIGSLITDYKISGTEIISKSTINDTLYNYFENNPDVDVATSTNSFSGMVNPSSQQFKDVDQCLSSPCHQNATCINNPANNTFSCQCNVHYEGDGFTCDRIVEVKVREEKVVNEWSTNQIIIVAVVLGVCLILIITLVLCLCCRSSHSYSTRGAFHRGGNLDNYYSTEAPSKDKTLTVPVAHNMYMTSEPSDGTTTFVEKYPMDSMDKKNSNFMK